MVLKLAKNLKHLFYIEQLIYELECIKSIFCFCFSHHLPNLLYNLCLKKIVLMLWITLINNFSVNNFLLLQFVKLHYICHNNPTVYLLMLLFCFFFFKCCRHGKIQSVRLVPKNENEKQAAIVAFMDIKAASKAHDSENVLSGVTALTCYNESFTATLSFGRTTTDSTTAAQKPGQTGSTLTSGSGVTSTNASSTRSHSKGDG